ncbi:hypothetical protein COS81_03015 [candidate division WWE3 bacterium CG06_land_8_20_14_3_00_42_16]|uniref:Uncharacterized protein n=3 Tax=Katanobacteria TaxID=422282 RepID=A0A2M7AMT1_UNCKA|nr:MAG: hypothetical protein COS81_03015 [candidate division WWE3 bacterium CG06_land_8_20_14_3_00_42_16]
MSTLTELKHQIRLTTKVILIALVLFIGYRIAVKIFQRTPPVPPKPKPNVLFGKLPFPQFEPIALLLSQNMIYELDLLTPSLPESPEKVYVYPAISLSASLFGPERDKKVAANYGFLGEPQNISETTYSWNDQENSRTFEINLFTRAYTLTFDWKKNPDSITSGAIKSESQAENLAIGLLKQSGIFPPDLNQGKRTVALLKLVGGEIRQIDKNEEASLARVDFFRQDVDKLSVYTSNPKKGSPSILLTSNSDSKKQILSLEYSFWNYDFTSQHLAEYPLKSSDEAWMEIQSGGGAMVYFNLVGLDPNIPYTSTTILKIRVKKVILGYYDSKEQQPYLEPIYVFECEAFLEGDKKGELTIYLPAITNDWLTTPEPTTETTETSSQ